MAYIPLPAYRTGQGINLEPVNAALDSIMQQNNQNRQFGLQQRASDRADQQFAFEQGQAKQAADRQNVELFGKRATAIDQAFPVGDPRRAQAYQNLISTHQKMFPGQALTGEELDPANGPKLMAAQAGMYLDPRDSQAKDLALQETRAKINKLNTEAANGGEAYGKTGAIFLNPDTGRYEAVQFGGRGQVKRTELGGLTPSRGTGEIDTGTGTQIIDKATGQPIRTVNKDVAGAASLREQGEAEGKAVADLPRQIDNAQLALDTIDAIRKHPGKQYGVGVYGVLPGIPGTQQRGFVNLVDQAKGQVFLQAFNSLRGGGQITEAEGSKATQALARMDRAQSQEDFDRALDDYSAIVQRGMDRARTQATRTPTTPGTVPAAPQAPANNGWTIKRVN
ncbi:hypothetical protein Hden_1588 [Hyphomicrobium denitrificans ATCC 51888]|uniref:Uncharacterized protein n=1 Tax=Hyphomicrobium denitrificans (strain ATCC 51888 / DSM 1869 / NCIMB 11706 / TK 0415) TaxID=582899 RepID=D8JQ75_HYPDA|nr:hypothetical protein [Hyphomicrobium denitrificans]ADJ21996.1 hypothetical protein Hden_0169 [Hyphomicrobium denitrificans ATCC 51888]ADJ23396.1 hypothetical protein Hden_1588 [Hyphomicrobium denitrificans ATCC 51888]